MIYTTLMNVQELHAILVNQKITGKKAPLCVLDCRCSIGNPDIGIELYKEGHIPGAVLCDFDRVVTGKVCHGTGRHPMPDRETFIKNMEALGVSSDKQIVLYDQGGLGFATRLWFQLRWIGLEKVAVLDGGYQAWVNQKFPVSTEPAVPEAGEIKANAPLEIPTEMKTVQDNLNTREYLVVDARSDSRFHGIGETIDKKAGHIPGSVCRPGSMNFNKDGTFKSPVKLRKEFLELLDGKKPSQIINSCGSGVNASVNLFAMDMCGLVGSHLYTGSWSQWIDDESNPIACN